MDTFPVIMPAATRLEIVALSDVGQERELNEDTVWAAPLSPDADNAWQIAGLLLVADGMGGHQAGEVASGLAGQTARQIFTEARPALAPAELRGQGLLASLASAVEEVNRAVFAAGESGAASGAASGGRPGTTLTLALLRADEWAIGHVGDSRAYLIRRSGAEQITADDSLVAEAVRRGQMTPEEAQTSQFRNQITKAIGLSASVAPSTYQGSWAAGDVILLCSDGLTEYITAGEMSDAISGGESLERACQSLIDRANRRGGHDNISIAAARLVPHLNGQSASSTNGTARKPATWPPVESPTVESAVAAPDPFVAENPRREREKPASKLPWIVATIAFGLGFAALGLWVGKRAAQPATVAVKKTGAASKSREQEIVVSPPKDDVVAPAKAPVVPDVLDIVFVDNREALVVTAPKYKLEVETMRDLNAVIPIKQGSFAVKLNHSAATQKELKAGRARIRCSGPSGGEISKIFVSEGSPGHFKLRSPLLGTYFLELYYPETKTSTTLAKIKLSKKPNLAAR